MIRGEIWTVAGGPTYAGKPRPAVILQSDLLIDIKSVITCGLTSSGDSALHVRPRIAPDAENGLQETSEVMTDKIMAVSRAKLGKRMGTLSGNDMARIEQALVLVLGLAD